MQYVLLRQQNLNVCPSADRPQAPHKRDIGSVPRNVLLKKARTQLEEDSNHLIRVS